VTPDAGFTKGAAAPLFDRLVDDAPHESIEERPMRVLNESQVIASIRTELSLLLNTRTDVSEETLWSDGLTVLDYGLPDFTSWYTRSQLDRDRLARYVARVISVFEPRLVQPVVSVHDAEYTRSNRAVRLRIAGLVVSGTIRTPVSFEMGLDAAVGRG
jgi:type VI secretion system protein ImpF